jgi:hypothetical protein
VKALLRTVVVVPVRHSPRSNNTKLADTHRYDENNIEVNRALDRLQGRIMSAMFEDNEISDKHTSYDQISTTSQAESINLRVLEWGSIRSGGCTDTTVTSAAELIARDQESDCELRIVLAPRDPKQAAEHQAIRLIHSYYDVSSAFKTIKATSPTHAFGHRKGIKDPNVEVAWTRFLCKDILSLSHQKDGDFHDNFRWIVCDAYLHVRPRRDESKCVTLLFFGAPPKVIQRFGRLLESDAWTDAVQEPYILFALVYEQLFLLLDQAAWTLAGWFRSKERGALDSVQQESSRVEATDFATLHEIAKHGIYLSEAAAAVVLGMEMVIAHLREVSSGVESDRLSKVAITQFQYQKASFRSTQLRLASLDKRIANVISLSFNLVTQRDSQVLRQDSNAMKAIAVLTLVFFPLTGIASLFSTPFFRVNGSHLWVSASIWVFWVITVCLTFSVFASWVWWYRSMKGRTAGILKQKPTEKLGWIENVCAGYAMRSMRCAVS